MYVHSSDTRDLLIEILMYSFLCKPFLFPSFNEIVTNTLIAGTAALTSPSIKPMNMVRQKTHLGITLTGFTIK
jgi:hypothetical protein